MNHDRLDKKFKDILGSMDEQDTMEAMNRKEDIWHNITGGDKRKNKNYLWLLILIGGLVLIGGWILNSLMTKSNSSSTQSFAQSDEELNTYKQELQRAQLTLESTQRLLDSVSVVNTDLASKISSLSQQKVPSLISSTIIEYDTIYLTEIKVEEKIVEKFIEKIIRDTIVVDRILSEDIAEPIADLDTEKNPKESEVFEESSNRPSSVRFNFSEATREDN